jgi:hypothetical protein
MARGRLIGAGNVAINVMHHCFVDFPNTGTFVERREGMMISRLLNHHREKGNSMR